MITQMFPADPITELSFAFQNVLMRSEITRLKLHSDFAAFYFNDYETIIKILKADTLNNPYSSKTQETLFFQHEDIIKKIIMRITSGIYTIEPVRKYIDPELIDETKFLNGILLRLNYNKVVKDAFRKASFFNTVVVGVIGERGKGVTRLDVITPDNIIVSTKDDYLQMKEIIIRKSDENNNIYYSVWNEDEHYIQYGDKKMNQMKNPFGKIPYCVLRIENGQDFYGEPNWNLFLAQKHRDIKLTDIYLGETREIHGILFGVNTNFDASTQFTPGTLHQVNNPDSTMQVSLESVSGSTDWSAIRENTDARLQSLFMSEGISNNSAATETKAQSGAAKTIDELETIERREEIKDTLWHFEIELLKLIETVHNTYSLQQIDSSERTIIFSSEKPFESIQDKIARREHEKSIGYYDNIDFTMQDLEVTQAEAELILEERKNRN